MTDPITPPPELAQRLWNNFRSSCESETDSATAWNEAIAEAFQAGADQELEACCDFLGADLLSDGTIERLRAARRPKPPSLKEQALEQLDGIAAVFRASYGGNIVCDKIRRALEALND